MCMLLMSSSRTISPSSRLLQHQNLLNARCFGSPTTAANIRNLILNDGVNREATSRCCSCHRTQYSSGVFRCAVLLDFTHNKHTILTGLEDSVHLFQTGPHVMFIHGPVRRKSFVQCMPVTNAQE